MWVTWSWLLMPVSYCLSISFIHLSLREIHCWFGTDVSSTKQSPFPSLMMLLCNFLKINKNFVARTATFVLALLQTLQMSNILLVFFKKFNWVLHLLSFICLLLPSTQCFALSWSCWVTQSSPPVLHFHFPVTAIPSNPKRNFVSSFL